MGAFASWRSRRASQIWQTQEGVEGQILGWLNYERLTMPMLRARPVPFQRSRESEPVGMVHGFTPGRAELGDFFSNDTATTEIYTLYLPDALNIMFHVEHS